MLSIVAHSSPNYRERTEHNASVADVTLAFAFNFETAGEKLTKRLAGEGYLDVPLSLDPLHAARRIYSFLKERQAKILNVAGNGIYTLAKSGWTQEQTNEFLYRALIPIHHYLPFTKIVSGGQTGIDLAGGVAGITLGVDVEMTLPAGYMQRHEDGKDRLFTEQQIRDQVQVGVEALIQLKNGGAPPLEVPQETPPTTQSDKFAAFL